MSNATTNPMSPVVIDIGENITKVLDVLSSKLGTTADHLMQVYVRQTMIEGWGFMIMSLLFIIILSVAIFFFNKKANFGVNDWNFHATIVFVCFLAAFITIIVFVCNATDAYSKIVNPEAYAFQYFTKNVGTLIGR
jgi:hypothetical protein